MSDDVYLDRNLLAIAHAVEHVRHHGDKVGGYYIDHSEEGNGWPVVWVDGGYGQRSWHVAPSLTYLLEDSILDESEPAGGYDGHDRPTKNERLVQAVLE